MPRVKYHKTKKDGIYWYRDSKGNKKYAFRYKYYDRFNKRREKTKSNFDSEKEAERALIEIKANILDGNDRYVENDHLTVAQWIEIWMESKKNIWRPNTYVHYLETYENHLKPLIGHYKIKKITSMTVQRELVDVLVQKGLKRVTIEGICRILMSAINAAVSEEILPRNRCKKLDFSAAPISTRENYYTEEELAKFLECAKENDPYTRYTTLFTLAMTGMRKGELMALKWNDIDFNKKTISITKARTRSGLGPPKSDNGYRVIPMNEELAKQIKRYRTWCIQKKWSKGEILTESDYVFITTKGARPIGLTYIEDAIDYICEKYQLKRIGPHGLRHTFTSMLIAKGVPAKTVAYLLGDDINTVNKFYTHSYKNVEIEAVQLLNEVVAKVSE